MFNSSKRKREAAERKKAEEKKALDEANELKAREAEKKRLREEELNKAELLRKKEREERNKKLAENLHDLDIDADVIHATTKIQAMQRGRKQRREQEEQAQAALKIQAIQRGKMARKEKEEQAKAALKIQAAHRGRAARKEKEEQAQAAQKIQAIHRGKMTRKELNSQIKNSPSKNNSNKNNSDNNKNNRHIENNSNRPQMVRPSEKIATQATSPSNSKNNNNGNQYTSTIIMPKTLPEAMRIIREMQSHEKDLLQIQNLQSAKLKTLKHKAETTVGQLAQEIDMLSTEMQEMRFSLEQESKKVKAEGNLRRAAEQETGRLRREIAALKREIRDATAKETRLSVDNQRLEAILGKVGDGALDEMERRLQKSEESRWKAEVECEKLRAELNWQTNSRMDERLTVASLEDELGQARAEKRRSEMRKIQVEEALEQCLAQLRSKKRECADMRKRIEMMISSNKHVTQQLGGSGNSFGGTTSMNNNINNQSQMPHGNGSTRFAAYVQDGTIVPYGPSKANNKMFESPKKANLRKASALRKQISTLRKPTGKGFDSYVDAHSRTVFKTGRSPDKRNEKRRGGGGNWR
eukprot:g5425.t1